MGVALLTGETRIKIEQAAANYDDSRSAVLPALHAAQGQLGYVPDEAIAEVAEILALSDSEVGAVASFYTMFFRKPVGEHVISVCRTLSCALLGSESLLDYLSRKLDVSIGGTTEDSKFTLVAVECLGACDQAPVAMIDNRYHGNLTEEKLDQILREMGWTGA